MMQQSVNQLRVKAAKRWAEIHSQQFKQHWHWEVVPHTVTPDGRTISNKPMVVRCASGEHLRTR